jgi:hypothetical protein
MKLKPNRLNSEDAKKWDMAFKKYCETGIWGDIMDKGNRMKLYRLLTENKNKKWLCRLISENFSGFTIYETIGYWQGKQEKSLVIEILEENVSDMTKIERICKSICGYSKQDVVMVQSIDVVCNYIGKSGI